MHSRKEKKYIFSRKEPLYDYNFITDSYMSFLHKSLNMIKIFMKKKYKKNEI
jgi:hypothetical protein